MGLVSGLLARCKASELFLRGHVQPELRDIVAAFDKLTFEVIDLVVGPLPFRGSGEAFDPFHENPAVPGSVEDHDLARRRQIAPEAPQVVELALLLGGGGHRDHPIVTGLHGAGDPPDEPAFSGGIPPLEGQNCSHPAFSRLNRQSVQPGLLFGKLYPVFLPTQRPGEIDTGEHIGGGVDISEHRFGHRESRGSGFLGQPGRQRRQDRSSDGQVAVPGVGGLDNRPGCTGPAGLPQYPLGDGKHRTECIQSRPVALVHLPARFGMLLCRLEFLLLNFRRGVQEEFQDQGTIGDQCVLHGGDMTKPDGEFGFVDITLGAQASCPHQAADEEGGPATGRQ